MACRNFLYILLALLLCRCAAPTIDGRALSSGGDMRAASLSAFDAHVRPALSTCTGCHGKKQAPLFLVENTSAAHDAAIGNVDFDDIEKSNFLKRIIEQEHNCGDCKATGKKVQDALTKWQAARAAAGNQPSSGVATQQLTLPTSKKDIQWDIGSLIDKQFLSKIALKVVVDPDKANKKYSLLNLEVYTDDIEVYVKGIKILINGKWNSKNTAYNNIACAVKPNLQHPTGHIIRATATSIVPDDFNANNKLSFAFEEIRLGTVEDDSCWSDDIHKDMFTSSIRPIIADNCEKANCHGTESPGPGGDILSTYSSVMDKNSAIASIIKAQTQTHVDRINELDDDDKQQLLDWLDN